VTVVALLPHDLAVISAVETIGKPVGFAAAPPGALAGVQAPIGSPDAGPDYVVVYPLLSDRDGDLGDAYNEAELLYQFTCVGRLAAGVRWLADQVEEALVGLSIPGREVIQITPLDGGGVRPDFDLNPPVFLATPRHRILSVPE
jgi:hypothetical protein